MRISQRWNPNSTSVNTKYQLISKFKGEYEFLSNFSYVHIVYDGVIYPTLEHAFQAAKTPNRFERDAILLASGPGKAKRLGQHVGQRSDWHEVRVPIMAQLLVQKFTGYPDLCRKLVATGDEKLVEGNDWGDHYWGVDGHGENMLGKLLMQIRPLCKFIYDQRVGHVPV